MQEVLAPQHSTDQDVRLMAPLGSNSERRPRGLRSAGDDAFKLTVDYLKQETIEPLKGLGRFLGWGLAGSLALAIAVLLGLIGLLRLLQEETGSALTGDWSWVPYVVVAVLGVGVAGFAGWRIVSGPAERKLPPPHIHPELQSFESREGIN
jgi:Putative Actinobacterial Holin-X, holin superfamily III